MTSRILELHGRGLGWREIADRVGRGGNYVRAVISRGERRGERSVAPRTAWLGIRVYQTELDRYRASARRSGIPLSEWVREQLRKAT